MLNRNWLPFLWVCVPFKRPFIFSRKCVVLFCFVLVLVFVWLFLLLFFLWVEVLLECLLLYLELMTVLLGTGEGMKEKKLVEMDCWLKFFFLRQNVLEESSKNRKSHSCLRCWKDVGRTHGLISCSVMW